MTIISTIVGKNPFRRNGVAITVNKRVQNAVLGFNLKNNRMITVHFQGKPFNITVIQVYAPTSNVKEDASGMTFFSISMIVCMCEYWFRI